MILFYDIRTINDCLPCITEPPPPPPPLLTELKVRRSWSPHLSPGVSSPVPAGRLVLQLSLILVTSGLNFGFATDVEVGVDWGAASDPSPSSWPSVLPGSCSGESDFRMWAFVIGISWSARVDWCLMVTSSTKLYLIDLSISWLVDELSGLGVWFISLMTFNLSVWWELECKFVNLVPNLIFRGLKLLVCSVVLLAVLLVVVVVDLVLVLVGLVAVFLVGVVLISLAGGGGEVWRWSRWGWLSARIVSWSEKTNRGFNIRELRLSLPSVLFAFFEICFLFFDLSKDIQEK